MNILTSQKIINTKIHEILQFFSTNKEKKKKNGLIKDVVRIENAEMKVKKVRELKW